MAPRYRASRSLIIQPAGFDRFSVTSSVASDKVTLLNAEAVRLLSFFLEPRTTAEAHARLGEELQVGEQELHQALAELIDNRLLVAADDGPPDPAQLDDGAFADPLGHHRMLLDEVRLGAYRAAIERHVPGKRVVDLGAGSGILSLLAARAGAREVIAIEESRIAGLARELFRANGVEDTVELVEASSLDVELDEPVDVVLHELFGDDPLDENLLICVDDARRRLLRPDGRLIPRRVRLCCCGIEGGKGSAGEGPSRRVRGEIEQLQARMDLDFAPLLERLHGRWTRRHVHRLPGPILTEEAVLHELDLMQERSGLPAGAASALLRVERDGRLDAFLISFSAQLDELTELSTSPRLPKTHWAWLLIALPEGVQVTRGQQLAIRWAVTMRGGCHRLDVELA